MERITTEITEEVLRRPPQEFDTASGAEVVFYGVVRGMEEGKPIAGIRYSAYLPMARRQLAAIGERFGPQVRYLEIRHRIGFVAAGEPSLLIRLGTPHSAAAFVLLPEVLAAVKSDVPVWKEPLPELPQTLQ